MSQHLTPRVDTTPAHYRQDSPWDHWVERGWEPMATEANIDKYMRRYRRKGGIQDLAKARANIDHLIELYESGQIEMVEVGS